MKNRWRGPFVSSKYAKSCVKFSSGEGHGGLWYCGIGLFFVWYFINFNFNVRYCGII